MSRKKKYTYWHEEQVAQDILDYQNATSDKAKEDIYTNRLYAPFLQLTRSNLQNHSTASYAKLTDAEWENDIMLLLYNAIPKYKVESGRSFAYFNVCCKNRIWQQNKKLQTEHNTLVSMEEIIANTDSPDLDATMELQPLYPQEEARLPDDYIQYVKDYWTKNFDYHYYDKYRRWKTISWMVINTMCNMPSLGKFQKKGASAKTLFNRLIVKRLKDELNYDVQAYHVTVAKRKVVRINEFLYRRYMDDPEHLSFKPVILFSKGYNYEYKHDKNTNTTA